MISFFFFKIIPAPQCKNRICIISFQNMVDTFYGRCFSIAFKPCIQKSIQQKTLAAAQGNGDTPNKKTRRLLAQSYTS